MAAPAPRPTDDAEPTATVRLTGKTTERLLRLAQSAPDAGQAP
ncbi:hypothetical protein AB0D86_48190 [Streptomyces sp. NPDC048324]